VSAIRVHPHIELIWSHLSLHEVRDALLPTLTAEPLLMGQADSGRCMAR
jgi:hypothetical protein